MKIDIAQAPPTLDVIKASRKNHGKLLWLSFFAGPLSMGSCYYWHMVHNELLLVPVTLSAMVCLVFLLAFAHYITNLPHSPISDAECAHVLRLIKESAAAHQYVEQVKAQERELVGSEYNALCHQVTFEETTQNKRALYNMSVSRK